MTSHEISGSISFQNVISDSLLVCSHSVSIASCVRKPICDPPLEALHNFKNELDLSPETHAHINSLINECHHLSTRFFP